RSSGGLPPQRQRLSGHRGAVGWQGDVRGIRREGPAGSGVARRPRDPRHHGLDDRAPGVHPASQAQGGEHRERLVLRLPADQAAEEGGQHGAPAFPRGPGGAVAENVWIPPYYEDDLMELAETIGVDKILFGSDWPHGEGLENPLGFTDELTGFNDTDIRKVMRDNALDLLGVQVGSPA